MSNFILLTRTGFKGFEEVAVNLDRVTMITESNLPTRGSTIWVGKTEVMVVESIASIQSKAQNLTWKHLDGELK